MTIRVIVKNDKAVVAELKFDLEESCKRTFDRSNHNWRSEDGVIFNKFFLKAQENYLNNRLLSEGHIFLNEALVPLGFKPTSEGTIIGWLANGDGDNHISFGIDPEWWEDPKTMPTNLKFNVDGVIFNKI